VEHLCPPDRVLKLRNLVSFIVLIGLRHFSTSFQCFVFEVEQLVGNFAVGNTFLVQFSEYVWVFNPLLCAHIGAIYLEHRRWDVLEIFETVIHRAMNKGLLKVSSG